MRMNHSGRARLTIALSALTLAGLLLPGCLEPMSPPPADMPPQSSHDRPTAWTSYVSPDGAYNLSYPSSWTRGEQVALDFLATAPSDEANALPTSLSVARLTVPSGYTLDRILAETLAGLERLTPNLTLLETTADPINETLHLAYNGMQGPTHAKFNLTLIHSGTTAYVATLTADINATTDWTTGLTALATFTLRPTTVPTPPEEPVIPTNPSPPTSENQIAAIGEWINRTVHVQLVSIEPMQACVAEPGAVVDERNCHPLEDQEHWRECSSNGEDPHPRWEDGTPCRPGSWQARTTVRWQVDESTYAASTPKGSVLFWRGPGSNYKIAPGQNATTWILGPWPSSPAGDAKLCLDPIKIPQRYCWDLLAEAD